jgi:hypothetical protein
MNYCFGQKQEEEKKEKEEEEEEEEEEEVVEEVVVVEEEEEEEVSQWWLYASGTGNMEQLEMGNLLISVRRGQLRTNRYLIQLLLGVLVV